MHNFTRSLIPPRAVQNARTRIFVPGSDPRFAFAAGRTRGARSAHSSATPAPATTLAEQRLFSPGLLDRLHAPLTRYAE